MKKKFLGIAVINIRQLANVYFIYCCSLAFSHQRSSQDAATDDEGLRQ